MRTSLVCLLALLVSLSTGCFGPVHPYLPEATGQLRHLAKYKIAPGDVIQVYVWRYPEVSSTVTVRPDGYVSAPLLEDIAAAGKTPSELARDLEDELSVYLRDPLVTVILGGGTGGTNTAGAGIGAGNTAGGGQAGRGIFPEQIRVIGEATKPIAMPYQDGITVLDLMIQVGGVTEFADANRTVLVRVERGERHQYQVRLDDLLKSGDITANVDLRPGDILIIPESWF